MPKAEASREGTPYPLKSLAGGQVTLRKLSYGEILERRQMAAQLRSKIGGNKRSSDGEAELSIKMEYLMVQHFDFSRCIINHNLEQNDGTPFDFSLIDHVQRLDPVVAQEIEDLVDSLNEPPEKKYDEDKRNPFRDEDKESVTISDSD